MAHLLRLHLQLPGEFRDAWLYKGHLYAWGRDGSLSTLELSRAFDHISAIRGPEVANVVNLLAFRNDWKFGQQFRNFMKSPSMEAEFLRPLQGGEPLVIELPPGLLSLSKSEKYGGAVLDTTIYADHVFMATAEGLLQSFIDPLDDTYSSRVFQHDDRRAFGVTVRYGAINVSAEERGLLFGSINNKSFEERSFFKATLRPVADYSRHSSFVDRDLLNYGMASAPELLRSTVVERELSPRTQEKYQVTGYRAPESIDALAHAATTTRVKVSNRLVRHTEHKHSQTAEVIGNSNNLLLVAWNDHLRVISMSIEPSVDVAVPDDIQAVPTKGYREFIWSHVRPDKILQTLPIRAGFLVEETESVKLITKDGVFDLLDEPVAHIRSFASSKQFKDVFVAVEEERISITGYYFAEQTLF